MSNTLDLTVHLIGRLFHSNSEIFPEQESLCHIDFASTTTTGLDFYEPSTLRKELAVLPNCSIAILTKEVVCGPGIFLPTKKANLLGLQIMGGFVEYDFHFRPLSIVAKNNTTNACLFLRQGDVIAQYRRLS